MLGYLNLREAKRHHQGCQTSLRSWRRRRRLPPSTACTNGYTRTEKCVASLVPAAWIDGPVTLHALQSVVAHGENRRQAPCGDTSAWQRGSVSNRCRADHHEFLPLPDGTALRALVD